MEDSLDDSGTSMKSSTNFLIMSGTMEQKIALISRASYKVESALLFDTYIITTFTPDVLIRVSYNW